MNFLTEQNALYEKQLGFRNNCYTMHHALTQNLATEKIIQACVTLDTLHACVVF